ncbi:MAG: Uma2 family endonuclease [Acidobacteria bacterium]|nr:Uma2 family endonuclease [Acidobacteriota bacterium]
MVTAEVSFSKEELIANLTPQNPLLLFGVSWADYEKISEEFGESNSFHITFNKGLLTIMPVTEIHELLISLIERFMTIISLVQGKNIVPTGKATMRSKRHNIAAEPDASYFIKKAANHHIKNYVPDEIELVPDIVVEIDVHHPSDDKFEIYSEFGVPEFWQYDDEKLKIFKLQENNGQRPQNIFSNRRRRCKGG